MTRIKEWLFSVCREDWPLGDLSSDRQGWAALTRLIFMRAFFCVRNNLNHFRAAWSGTRGCWCERRIFFHIPCLKGCRVDCAWRKVYIYLPGIGSGCIYHRLCLQVSNSLVQLESLCYESCVAAGIKALEHFPAGLTFAGHVLRTMSSPSSGGRSSLIFSDIRPASWLYYHMPLNPALVGEGENQEGTGFSLLQALSFSKRVSPELAVSFSLSLMSSPPVVLDHIRGSRE